MPLSNNISVVVDSSSPVVGSKQIAPGVVAMVGKKPDGNATIHTILFRGTMFGLEQVRTWLGKYNVVAEKIEAAQPSQGRIERECKIILRDGAERKAWGVVAEPGLADSDGRIITAYAIRQAAHNFLLNYQNLGYRHVMAADARIIESYIVPTSTEINGEKVPVGSWVLGAQIQNDTLWQEIESGVIVGFRLGGIINAME